MSNAEKIAFIAGYIAMSLVMAFGFIWAINVIFSMEIPYTWKTILAAAVILDIMRGIVHRGMVHKF